MKASPSPTPTATGWLSEMHYRYVRHPLPRHQSAAIPSKIVRRRWADEVEPMCSEKQRSYVAHPLQATSPTRRGKAAEWGTLSTSLRERRGLPLISNADLSYTEIDVKRHSMAFQSSPQRTQDRLRRIGGRESQVLESTCQSSYRPISEALLRTRREELWAAANASPSRDRGLKFTSTSESRRAFVPHGVAVGADLCREPLRRMPRRKFVDRSTYTESFDANGFVPE